MDSELSHEERFFGNVEDMGAYVLDLVQRVNQSQGKVVVNTGMVSLGTTLLKTYVKKELVENFIEKSYIYWDRILEREEQFMVDHALEVFSGLPMENVSAFKQIFLLKDRNGQPVVDDEDRNIIWEYMFSFVKISLRYIHDFQGPYSTQGNPRYSRRYPLAKFDLFAHAKKWNVDLFFPDRIIVPQN